MRNFVLTIPDAGYTNPELAWGKYPITIQGIEVE